MNIRIQDIDEQGLDAKFVEDESWGTDLPPHDKVLATLRVERSGEFIRVQGTLKTVLKLECSRCLAVYDFPIEVPVDSTLVPASRFEEEESKELTGEDMDLRTYEGEEFNVDDIISENIVLILPIKPLCREDCKGLCPNCGADRNKETCTCAKISVDDRFSALKKIKFDT